MMDYFYEQQIIDKGYKIVCGMDEAGRGPLAGAVFAAAVILPQGLIIEGLNDSKKLTEKKRDKLFDVIKENAISYGIASVSAEEIDEINILNASMLAMRRAAEMLEPKPDAGLIDGNTSRGFTFYTETLVKGDSLSPSIAAASILAKVSRDKYMAELAALNLEAADQFLIENMNTPGIVVYPSGVQVLVVNAEGKKVRVCTKCGAEI